MKNTLNLLFLAGEHLEALEVDVLQNICTLRGPNPETLVSVSKELE